MIDKTDVRILLIITLLVTSIALNIFLVHALKDNQKNSEVLLKETWAIVEEKNRQMLKRELEFRADLKEIDSLLKKSFY